MPPSSPPAHSSWHHGHSELHLVGGGAGEGGVGGAGGGVGGAGGGGSTHVLSGVRDTQWRDMAVRSTPSSLKMILEEEQTPPSSQVSTPPAELGPAWSE